MSLEELRRAYAAAVCGRAGVRSERLRAAVAETPRERFLGPGPWTVAGGGAGAVSPQPRQTPDADPTHIYEDVSVALDSERHLFNGAPGVLLAWIDALDPREGDRVYHVGGGTGYYTALLARAVGPAGRVVMAEADHGLAGRARDLLAELGNVEVTAGDGSVHDPGMCDRILVNAGATHPAPLWLDRLKPGGRLLVPLTFEFPNSHLGKGAILQIGRAAVGFSASFVSAAAPVVVYSCQGVRSGELNDRLLKAYSTQTHRLGEVRSLRRDRHEAEAECWVHAEELCLSTRPARNQ